MGRIFNRREQLAFRRHLRRNMTTPEQLLWHRIRSAQLGVKFRRQHGIGPYVVDFYCPSLGLVLEIDGDSHFVDSSVMAQDLRRSRYLSGLGLHVLRFSNREVMHNTDGVLTVLMAYIARESM
ncbi:endonuclease domain-containing protein [Zobellella denitrificans]